MSLKRFYGEMDKKDRQIFSEIEKMIVNSKIECLAAIPKNQVYNDSEIKNKIQSLESQVLLAKKNYNESKQVIEAAISSIEKEKPILLALMTMDERLIILSELYDYLKLYVFNKSLDVKKWKDLEKRIDEIEDERIELGDKANKALDNWDKKYFQEKVSTT